MVSILGYSILEQIYKGSRTLVYRAIRENDQKSVIIKLLKNPYPDFNEILEFRHQYTIGKNLQIRGIVRPLSLERYGNSYILVTEDFGGVSLRKYMQGRHIASLIDVLSIAVQIADILHDLHQNRIIHKDIKPSKILINPETKQVKLIDFSFSSLLAKEIDEIKNPNSLEGTLAYLSPEQTGRMNRGVDYRADFYALGVTLFELLTGELPFQSDDAMDLVHCHIAKIPPNIKKLHFKSLVSKEREWLEDIPQVISDIANKLMAKSAEDRYQSALGLKYDLEICLQQLKDKGKIKDFEIAKRDICDRFIIPEKLYGREKEVEELLTAFGRVSKVERESSNQEKNQTPQTELILVAGYFGIGKTALVSEINKPIVKQHGYFLRGKFDQLNSNIPFSGFVQVFRDLIRKLLSKSDTQLSHWKNKILQALGDNAQIIIEVIPELEKIIGQQPSVRELSGIAAQNRFNLLFQKFIQAFTTKQHPLVIFLDDLQWADSASLKLMRLLMLESQTGYLLMIGAYRENEVFAAHPLMLMLNEIKTTTAKIKTINLKPLGKESLTQLVAQTLSCNLQLAQPLTEIIYQKTQGNPFFATQFIQKLHEDGLIYFDSSQSLGSGSRGGWQCDITKIREATLTDDAVELMVLQLQKLPTQTQEILKLAACLGNQFDLTTLIIISDISQADTTKALWEALQSGLILPQSELYNFYLDDGQEIITDRVKNTSYRFSHNKVQQAAYSLIPDNQKQTIHHHIGQLLLQQISPGAREERIFELVNQLNHGITLITEHTQRSQLAQLNLIACRKAKSATAYQAGREYAKAGLSLFGDNAWQEYNLTDVSSESESSSKKEKYEMNLAFHELAAELASLCADFEVMEDLIEEVIAKAYSLIEKINVYQIRIQSYISQNKLTEAIGIGKQVLQQLGITFPETATQNYFQNSIAEIHNLIGDRKIADFVNLPPMTDAEKIAIMEIANGIMGAAYICASPLYPLLITLSVKLSIQYGNTLTSAFAYVSYSVVACNFLQDIDTGVKFGEVALGLVSRQDAKAIKPETLYILGLFTLHRNSHIRTTLPLLQTAYATALELGNIEFVGYAAQAFCLNSFFCSKSLDSLEQEISAYCQELVQLNQLTAANYCRIYWQSTLNLLKVGPYPTILSGEVFQESKFLPQLQEANDLYGLYFFYLYKLIFYYLFGEIKSAQNYALEVRNYLMAGVGTVGEPAFYLYDSLVALATLNLTSQHKSVEFDRVEQNQTQLQNQWAHYAPMNHQHKVYLVSAEKYRVLGQQARAIELYDKAISLAKANKYIAEEALANELAARFYLNWGKEKIAQIYMQEAYYCYARWGAAAKTDDLEKRYPYLLAPILQQVKQNLNTPDASMAISASNISIHNSTQIDAKDSTNFNNALDFAAILKASQALSGTIQLDNLLHQLTRIILQNSGGDRCALILPNENSQWYVKAIATAFETELCSQPLENNPNLPTLLIQYVKNTHQVVVIDDLNTDLPVIGKYLLQKQPKSVLCLPLLNQGNLIGILYLKNRSTSGVFTKDRIRVLNFLCTQAVISLENARLYAQEQEKTRQIAQKEAQYRSIFESVNDGLSICDLETTKIIAANPTLCQIYGYNQEEFLNLTLVDLLHPDYLNIFNNFLENLIEGNNFYTQGIGRRKDGSFFDFEVKAVPLNYQGKLRGLSIVRDISHSKQAEIALKTKTEELDRFFSLALDLLCIVNTEGYFLRLNSQWQKTLGYPLSELEGKILFDYVHPDDIEKTHQELALLKNGESKFNLVNRYRCSDGSYRWIEWRANAANEKLIYVAARDITERKKSEDHLRELSVRLNLAVESAGIGIWDWDIQQNQLIWDRRMYKLYGIRAEQFSNAYEAWINSLHPEDRESAKPDSVNSLQGDKDYDAEFRVIHPDGNLRFIKANALVQRNSQGEPQRMIGINYDITEQKQAQIQLEQTNEELIRATRLKDEFLANMSHELRTPLNAILGMTEGLQEGVFGELTEQQCKPLQTIERSGSHLLELINDILDVAKIESGQIKLELTETAIVPLCQSSLSFIKQQAQKKSIQLETKLPGNLPHVLIDERRIRQVLINLLNNAVKFTPDGGRITLSLAIVERPTDKNSKNSKDAPYQTFLQIAIIDTGIGIAPEHINKLFQPFIQIDSALNRQYAGTGLGLVLVKRIVELHGGQVAVSSQVGVGSCFTIDLPSTQKAGLSTSQPENQFNKPTNPNLLKQETSPLILLAEDNEGNIITLSSYLKAKGYRLILAKNGQEAIEKAIDAQPDLILMDIQMPGMDGLEAIGQIRQNPNLFDIPIIALTALAMKGDRERCLEKGADDYLSKPVKLKQLALNIQQLLAARKNSAAT